MEVRSLEHSADPKRRALEVRVGLAEDQRPTVTLGIVSGAVWWFIGPRVREWVQETTRATRQNAEQLQPGGDVHASDGLGVFDLGHADERRDEHILGAGAPFRGLISG